MRHCCARLLCAHRKRGQLATLSAAAGARQPRQRARTSARRFFAPQLALSIGIRKIAAAVPPITKTRARARVTRNPCSAAAQSSSPSSDIHSYCATTLLPTGSVRSASLSVPRSEAGATRDIYQEARGERERERDSRPTREMHTCSRGVYPHRPTIARKSYFMLALTPLLSHSIDDAFV